MTIPRAVVNNDYYYEDIPLERLFVSEHNVRRQDIVADVDGLAHNIELHDLQQPIVVQPKGDRFEIIIGQRRFYAFRKLGRPRIPAKVITKQLDEFEIKALSFSENVQRRDLNPRDKASVCTLLVTKLGTVKAVSENLGVSETTVRKWLGYAGIPEKIKALVDNRQLTRGQASHVWETIGDETRAVTLAEKIAELRPPVPQQRRIMAAMEEMPDRPVDVILKHSDELQHIKEIVFILPQEWARAIDRASRELDKDPNDIAKEATIDWLRGHLVFAQR